MVVGSAGSRCQARWEPLPTRRLGSLVGWACMPRAGGRVRLLLLGFLHVWAME